MTTEILETVHANIRGNIENKDIGFSLMCIGACSDGVGFYYTIGLTEQGLPELFLSGNLRPQTVNAIFYDLVQHWKQEGVMLGENNNLAQGKDGSDMRMRLVSLDEYHPSLQEDYAVQLFQHYFVFYPEKAKNDISVVQLIWPDERNIFPMEQGYNTEMAQTLLPVRGMH